MKLDVKSVLKGCLAAVLLSTVLLLGCQHGSSYQSTPRHILEDSFSVPAQNILLPTVDNKRNLNQEIILSRLSDLLQSPGQSKADRAELYYQLGVVCDMLGLENTAGFMFSNAIDLVPGFAPAYNFIGIYLSAQGRFSEACDAFDAALELDAEDFYVNFSRAITLYYAKRYQQALEDLLIFYEHKPADPYILLWLYLTQRELLSEQEALQQLKDRYTQVPEQDKQEQWGFNIVKLYLGTLSEQSFFNGTKSYQNQPAVFTDHLCEGYFYLGKLKELEGSIKLAYDYFKLTVACNRYGFVEYRYAQLELLLLEREHGLRNNIYAPLEFDNLKETP